MARVATGDAPPAWRPEVGGPSRDGTRRAVERANGWARDGDDGPANPPGSIVCDCGALLADRIDGKNVVIDGVEYQFRRRSDTLQCPDCGVAHPMWRLRAQPDAEVLDSGLRRRRTDAAD